MGTDTRVEVEITGGVHELLGNETLAKVMDANLRIVGGYTYTAEERDFAAKIQKTFTSDQLPPLESTSVIQPLRSGDGSASTDVGDVSWTVPTVGLSAATWVPGTAAHSWQAVAAGGTSIGSKGMMIAAKTMALAAVDLYSTPTIIEEATKEFRKKRGENFKYEALIGDRAPALDYRK
jgi:aminobenzoyl-glutamate utilization protein B